MVRSFVLFKKRFLGFRNRYKYFIYISILFLIFTLYKANYLKIPHILSFSALIISFLFLFGGFISQAFCWKKILETSDYHISFGECLAGHGLTIFGKYIPGKIWAIIGRAAYVSEKDHLPLGTLSALSINEQFISIWVGLIFGIVGLFLLHGFRLWGWVSFLLWVGLTIVIFSKPLYKAVEYFIKFLLKKNIELPIITMRSLLSIIPWSIVFWASWSIGFYFLAKSLTTIDIPLSISLGFPLAGIIGAVAFFAPGGIGIREGVMIGYFSLAGIAFAEATTISIVSRFWFLLGEIFIFSLGWVKARKKYD
jgi:uncharacterized membrane protein YbhN (UPF0104 family)